jgi:hypothetical protein
MRARGRDDRMIAAGASPFFDGAVLRFPCVVRDRGGSSHVRYAPKATDNRFRAKCRDGPETDIVGGHSSRSSARITTDCEIARPNAFAAFMLITISNFVGCSTGRSAGFEPLKIILT